MGLGNGGMVGRGVTSLPVGSSEGSGLGLVHEVLDDVFRIAIDLRQHLIAMLPIEVRRLEAQRGEVEDVAATPSGVGLEFAQKA